MRPSVRLKNACQRSGRHTQVSPRCAVAVPTRQCSTVLCLFSVLSAPLTCSVSVQLMLANGESAQWCKQRSPQEQRKSRDMTGTNSRTRNVPRRRGSGHEKLTAIAKKKSRICFPVCTACCYALRMRPKTLFRAGFSCAGVSAALSQVRDFFGIHVRTFSLRVDRQLMLKQSIFMCKPSIEGVNRVPGVIFALRRCASADV
jgi:hypothetical protein